MHPASLEPSYVLRALGVSEDGAHLPPLRHRRFTMEREIDPHHRTVPKHVDRLREMSPLWEMVKEGIDISKIEVRSQH